MEDAGPRLAPSSRLWRAAGALGVASAFAAAPVLVRVGDVPLCAFRALAGRPCPLCGGTRACAAIAEGNLAGAWQANPAVVPLLFVALFHAAQLAIEAAVGRAGPRAPWAFAWAAALVVLLGGWVLRLLVAPA